MQSLPTRSGVISGRRATPGAMGTASTSSKFNSTGIDLAPVRVGLDWGLYNSRVGAG